MAKINDVFVVVPDQKNSRSLEMNRLYRVTHQFVDSKVMIEKYRGTRKTEQQLLTIQEIKYVNGAYYFKDLKLNV